MFRPPHRAAQVVPSSTRHHRARHETETPKLGFSRVDVSNRMRRIVEQLRPMRKETSEILTTLGSTWKTAPDIGQSRPITTSESIEPRLYGRDGIMKNIIHDITQGKYYGENLTVLPIVGLGGIGKTTLAQHIYHNQEVQKHFEVMIWKCVSLNFNVNKLMEDVENHVPKVQDEKNGTAEELIGQRIKSKRFLLVLDDMWEFSDEDEWKRLLLPFKKSQVKGNIIIVTTRSPKLGEMVKTTHHPIELEGIDREEFKRLFLAFVFGDEQPTLDHTVLLETGYKIMDKLKGSPLAAKTVGRLLRHDLDLDHWTRVLESKEWESQRGSNDIMPALKLSYDCLPFDLQQCFSYCALFPQDYKFDSKELILFWIGQDVLHSGDQNNLTVEDIGLRNIRDLVSHGFFKKDETEGRAGYTIHDLLHDLASKVTSHECLNVHLSSKTLGKIRPSIRHLSITLDI
nr:disease resistance protein RGA2-like [Setaria viridis]